MRRLLPSRPPRTLLAGSVLLLLGASCAPQPQLPAAAAQAAVDFPSGWGIPPRSVVATRAAGGVVTTTDRVASEIGAEVLRRGGNAVDAAVAIHFALAVVNPEAGNIGGGGFLVARTAGGEAVALDFREKAPLAARPELFASSGSLVGHRAAGVPGSVAGMWEAHRRLGSLPWAELVLPAIHLAEGVVVHERLARSLDEYAGRLAEHPASAAVFLREGRPPRVGDRLVQADLAETLRRVARDGRDGFYRGPTAELVAAEMRRGGG